MAGHDLDDLDRALLELVQQDDRLSYADLGKAVGLSISGVNARLRKLTASGVIARYSAQLDPAAVGLHLCAFVHVVLERPEHDAPFIAAVRECPAILECHHVTGDYSYLLKVRVPTTADLERLITHGIKTLPGVARTHTVIALSSPKETAALPLDHLKSEGR
jgi:Lrp/AsnC family leucine-responsive transcriptional regulator